MTALVHTGAYKGEAAVRLVAGSTAFTFLPGLGMLGARLRHQGGDYLSLHGGPAAFEGGHTTGLPLLAPWANRLGATAYRAGRETVDLTGAPHVGHDGNGLPMHGTMLGRREWELVYAEADLDEGRSGGIASLLARFRFGDHPDLLASFPFPHDLDLAVRVSEGQVAVETSVTPTGRRRVPVSFGWHPYFRLPGVRRRGDLVVHLPARHRLVLDDQMIPTGDEQRRPAEAEPLGGRTFDDAFRLGRSRVLGLSGPGGRSITIELDPRYPFAQVYAPAGRSFVALEPMTAPANALVTGHHPTVEPGTTFTAGFTLTLT